MYIHSWVSWVHGRADSLWEISLFYDLDLLSCGRDPFRSFIVDLGSDVQAGLKDTDCSKVGWDF
jgi:hypothetical protein